MKQDVQNQPVKKGNPYMGFLGVILIVLILNGLVFPKLTGQADHIYRLWDIYRKSRQWNRKGSYD